ncbi:hypothetical protein [Catenulispora rubra]|uniref:hypothetical protein n=1 Tax=Catenulispora rubra TaxID=280293 RepID=UPI0018924CD9|nr:hypothetical protein [Catenulispora rubra]
MSTPLNLAGDLIATDFEGWSPELREEFERNAYNDQVGSELLSEDARVKVWMITVPPGGRLPAHRHILDYFWTALSDGHSLQHTDDGTTRKVSYRAGQTHHLYFAPGQYLLHDLVNDGATELRFLTVEHKRSE